MDCSKVGALIQSLRQEKKMSQRELAERLCISPKTVSKWETGSGCPDVSLLGDLSRILGVSVENMLSGGLHPRDTDGGNMKHIKFYLCPACGNVVTATSRAEVSCCGRRLEPLVPQQADGAHRASITAVEDEFFTVLPHPMEKGHFVPFVALAGYDRVALVRLYPEQDAEARLPRLGRGKLYVCCSRDGLFVQDTRPDEME